MKYPWWKRIEDVVGSVIALIVILPLLPIIATAVKLEYPKEKIFVKLSRISEGRIVYVYKFRNMIPGADKMKPSLKRLNERSDGPFFKIKDDPRVTLVGRILRKFRIDEFPQLINVLRGELALVGPRPHEPEEVNAYPEEYKDLPKYRAGVTGLSQVSGASSLPFLKELELDKSYIENQSLWADFKILTRSALIIFFDPSAV